MTDDYKHGLTLTTCSFCRPRPQRPPDVPRRTIRARYDGRCGGCEHPVSEGDPLGLFEAGEWLCEACW